MQILKENGILVPTIYLKGETIPDGAFPLLARKRYHSQGRDIIYIHDREQLENDLEDDMYDFLVEYVNKTSEYRVHFLRDYDTLVSVKFNPDNDGDPIVRSHQNKWNQISYDREWKDALIELAKKTMDILGYDFGAIDIIRKKDKLYVLEINTAPGLEDRKLNIYADYFRKMERRWRENR
jgi:glutathione synthase/RimK-type ligase-like ATP-grasp enzyme